MQHQNDQLEKNEEGQETQGGQEKNKITPSMADLFYEEREAKKNDGGDLEKNDQITEPLAKDKDQKDTNSQKEADQKDRKEKSPKISEDKDSETSALKGQLEEIKSRMADNQKFGRQSVQKIKSALNLVKEMTESGLLDEEDAERFAQVLNVDPKHLQEDEKPDMYSIHPLGGLLKIADAELVNMKKYTDDDLLDEKIQSFNHFITGDDPSLPDVLEELNDLADDPVALTKKMLQVGKKHFDEVYGELKKSGGLSLYLKKFKEKEERLTKQIDKMKKRLAEYEDYNDSSYRIDSVSDSVAGNDRREDMSDSYYDDREKRQRKK